VEVEEVAAEVGEEVEVEMTMVKEKAEEVMMMMEEVEDFSEVGVTMMMTITMMMTMILVSIFPISLFQV